MNRRGQLIIISGPAGTGKGTIVKALLEDDDMLKLSVSATTRSPRPMETNGVEYYFKTRDEFEAMIADNDFIEYTSYNGNYYGTPKTAVLERLNDGISVILEIEVEGAKNASEALPEAIMIFLAPPSKQILRERLIGRGTETLDVVENRLKIAEKELSLASNYKYIVVNNTIEGAVNDIKHIRAFEGLMAIINDKNADKDELRIAEKILDESNSAHKPNFVQRARELLVENNAELIAELNR